MSKQTIFLLSLLLALAFSIGTMPVNAQTPELVVQRGHVSDVTAIAFSPDGKVLASASQDGNVKLWDIRTGKQIRTLAGHSLSVYALAFSPDGQTLATADAQIKLWNFATGQLLNTLEGHWKYVNSLAFSPDGQLLASAGSDSLIIIWWNLLAEAKIHATIENTGAVNAIAFSPDGSVLVSGNENGAINWWDVETGELHDSFWYLFEESDVRGIDFSPDGKLLASAGHASEKADYTMQYPVILWDTETGEQYHVLLGHSIYVWSVAFHPSGEILASSDSNGQIKLWEVHSGKEIRTLVGHSKLVRTLAFSPDGKLLASGGADKTLKLWQVSTGKMLRDLTVGVERLYTCAIRPAGQAFAFGGDDKIVRFWDLAEGEKIKTLRGHTDWVNDVVFSPDGNLLASASSDCTIKIWDAKKGQAVRTLKGHKASVNALAFSPDGKILASGSGFPNFSNFENDCSIKLWEVATGQCLRTLNKHTDQISRLVFHPAGRMLASCSDDSTIILWDIFAGNEKLLLKIHDDIVYDIVFHPQGDVLASSSWDKETGGMIKLWQLSTEKVIAHFEELEQPAATLAFSPDGKILAGGSVAGVKFWDMETRKEIPALTVETEEVRKLAFSPDGKRLLGACEDATARLWNLPGAQEIARLIITGPGDYVVATPDNYYYATKEAYKGLAFRLENKAYPFEQYDLKLNRPDIVLQRLGYASPTLMQVYHHAYLKRLKKMHFTEDMLGNDFHLPEITLTTPELPVSTTDKQLRFVIKANDSLYRLARLNVSVNDVPIYDANGFSLRNEQITTMEKEISLELSHGRNKIQVSALNEKGAESLKETFEIIYNGKEAQENLYVVAIGVSKYRSSQYNLTYAAKDADDLAALLESKKNKFGEVHVLRVLNKNATRENILAARQFLMQSKVDDEVIVFAAGHGLLDDQLDYYFATTDIDFAHPAQRGLTYETIESLLDGIPARKKLLLMDTCHSGEVDKEETALVAEDRLETGMVKSRSFRNVKPAKAARHLSLSSSFELLRELFADLRRSSGAMVISAASGVEFAYEDHQWQNGAFTYCVLEGLKTGHADLNKDGEIHVSELRDYVSEKVQKLTNGKQTPTSRRENLEFDFKIF